MLFDIRILVNECPREHVRLFILVGRGGGVTGKVELRSTIARSSDIVLPGVCLHLNLVHRNSVNTPK